MGLLYMVPLATVAAGAVGATSVAIGVTAAQAGPDIWSTIQAGGAPMAVVLLAALIEVVRRHDRAYKVIEEKDAVILEMAKRQVEALHASADIASDQMKIAQNTDLLLRELVALGRGRIGG